MKKSWAVALAVTLTAIAVALALVLTGLWPSPQAAPAQPVDGSLKVKAGQAVVFPSADGSPEVRIPADAISGEGVLQVKPVQLPDSRSGWAIDLADGASLTGEATLVFKGVVKEGEPAPLVGFTESPEDDPRYITDAEVSGSDMIVRTTHFSNWFTDGWDWVTQWARNKLDSVYKGSGYGSQPECERESEARAGGVEVTSDSGGAVQWCVGKQADGATVLKVNNSRGYAVSAESTPGLTLATRSLDFGQMVPRLAKYITAPTKKGNTINIIGPGETVEYKVDPSVAVAVRLDPSPPAYLATALWFGIETTTMVYGKVFGKISSEAVGTAMDAANCAAGFQGMATTDVINGSSAGKYLNEALGTVMACSGKVFMSLAKGKMLDMLAVSVAQVFTWVWSGIQTAAHGFAAAADTALNFKGYKIFVTPPPAQKEKAGNSATTFITRDPWRDGTLATVTNTHDSAGKATEGCTSSEISPREDGFRCFAPGIYDPCYQSPTNSAEFLCFSWTAEERRVTHLKNIKAGAPIGATAPTDSSVVFAELTDGTICRRATGAGPQGVPGYPYWTGVCTGPSGGVWRVGEADIWKASSSTYPLYPPTTVDGYHRIAISIGSETSSAQLMDVKMAYR